MQRLKDYKENGDSDLAGGKWKGKRACVRIFHDHQTDMESKVLYVGSTGKNFHTRIKQHLGFSSASTYSLQLVHWAKKLDLQLILYYLQLPPEDEGLRYEIEDALAEKMQPLVGKRGGN